MRRLLEGGIKKREAKHIVLCITGLKLGTCLEFQVALVNLPLVLNLFQNSGKWTILGQLKNKIQKMSSLSITRKNELFPQYPIRKFNVFFVIVLGLSKQISLSDTEVTFLCAK